MGDLKKLQELSIGFKLLYVEDNEALRLNATKLLEKFFSTIYVASDGLEGWELFKQHRPYLVLTDIKMPHLDGMSMSKKIKHASPATKIIVMSAFDEKDYLYKAIEIGVFRFIKKPVELTELTETLIQAIIQINHETKENIFQAQLGSIFNYQSSMIVMLSHTKPIVANQVFLDYYEVEDVEELNTKYEDIGTRFLEHDGFLYNDADGNWTNKILADRSKIHNVKMKNRDGELRHFILKCRDIPDKNNHGILSFDDITELNLLGLFNGKTTKKDDKVKNKVEYEKAIYDLLAVIKRNNAKVSLHNYYKGITITNDSSILEIKDESVVFQTSYIQQKAIQFEKKSLIVSEALPYPITCATLNALSFDKQIIEFAELQFSETSPVTRDTVRLVPEETHKVTMFIGETKYIGDVRIEDISLNAVKLALSVVPAGFDLETEVILDMVFTVNKQPLIINTKGTLFRKREVGRIFEAVFMFKLDAKTHIKIVNYITKRQMAIIREFKGLQNGK